MFYRLKVFFRLIRRLIYRFIRQCFAFYFGLYLRKIHNPEFFPKHGPFLIVSNHLSFLDSLIISSIFKDQYIVVLASNRIKKQPIMYWLSKFNITIFIDTNKSNIYYLVKIISFIKRGYIVLVYPEGSRSRDGYMREPKSGFVKIALSTNIPIVPVSMKGTFEILQPHKILPKFKRCEVFVGEKIFVNRNNSEFTHYFDKRGHLSTLGTEIIAFEIMNKIAKTINQSWDMKVYQKLRFLKIDVKK